VKKVVAAKLHGIRVTDSNINYHGSITLDPDHCEEALIHPLEFVEIWNKASGARITTYVIFGVRGSRCCILNGAAARTCQTGDELIICSSDYIEARDIAKTRPRVLVFGAGNAIVDRVVYETNETATGYSFNARSVPDFSAARPVAGGRAAANG
jgi:aspartate 1-decarboxylase